MQYKETNLNYYIKVKLTEKGKEIYREYLNDVLEEYEINDIPKIEVDEEGYSEFQMWDFMRIFGKHFHILGDNPCETNCLVQVKEDKEIK